MLPWLGCPLPQIEYRKLLFSQNPIDTSSSAGGTHTVCDPFQLFEPKILHPPLDNVLEHSHSSQKLDEDPSLILLGTSGGDLSGVCSRQISLGASIGTEQTTPWHSGYKLSRA